MLKRNIILIYIYGFLTNFLLYRSCDTLYYLEKGVSSSGYILFIVISYFISLLVQVPSGILADKYNKKKILLFSQSLVLLSIILFIVADSYWLLVLAIIIQAFQSAFAAGMTNAIIHQSLDDKKSFSKALFYKSVFIYSGYIIAMLLGGYVGNFSLVAMYYISLIPVIINFIVIGLLDNTKLPAPETTRKREILKDALSVIRKNKIIISMFLIAGFNFACLTIVAESHPEYAANLGVSPFIIGIYTAIMCLFDIIGEYLCSKEKYKKKNLLLVPFCMGISVLIIGLLNNVYGIIFIVLIQFFFAMYSNSMYTTLHSLVSDKSRVTVESILSLVVSGFGILLGLLVSVITKFLAISNTYIILGIFSIIYTLIILIWSACYKAYQGKF